MRWSTLSRSSRWSTKGLGQQRNNLLLFFVLQLVFMAVRVASWHNSIVLEFRSGFALLYRWQRYERFRAFSGGGCPFRLRIPTGGRCGLVLWLATWPSSTLPAVCIHGFLMDLKPLLTSSAYLLQATPSRKHFNVKNRELRTSMTRISTPVTEVPCRPACCAEVH